MMNQWGLAGGVSQGKRWPGGVPLNKNPIIYQAEKVLKNEVLINERPLDIVQNIREIPGQKALEYHRNSHLFNAFWHPMPNLGTEILINNDIKEMVCKNVIMKLMKLIHYLILLLIKDSIYVKK